MQLNARFAGYSEFDNKDKTKLLRKLTIAQVVSNFGREEVQLQTYWADNTIDVKGWNFFDEISLELETVFNGKGEIVPKLLTAKKLT